MTIYAHSDYQQPQQEEEKKMVLPSKKLVRTIERPEHVLTAEEKHYMYYWSDENRAKYLRFANAYSGQEPAFPFFLTFVNFESFKPQYRHNRTYVKENPPQEMLDRIFADLAEAFE